MFKSAILYRIPQHTQLPPVSLLSDLLEQNRHVPLTALEGANRGWVPVVDDTFIYKQGHHLLVKLRTDKKLLPASVVKEALNERIKEIQERDGYKPGRKQQKELKEEIIDTLLATAFVVSSETMAWIDLDLGWLVINTSSKKRADEVVSSLIKALSQLPLETLYVNKPIGQTLTEWLAEGEAPEPFTVDQDAELTARGTDGGKVKYSKHSLDAEEMQRHIAAGKQCTRLALTWKDRVSFVLTDDASLRRIKPLDVVTETATPDDNADAFSSNFALMTGELSRMIGDLIEAFGGVKPRESEAAA